MKRIKYENGAMSRNLRGLGWRVAMAVLLAIMSVGVSYAQSAVENTYFPYPMVPDSISSLEGRSNFFITHFWDFCDVKKAMSSRTKFTGALVDYLSFMPYARPDVIKESVQKLMHELDKQPDDQLFVARKAEDYLYGDSGRYQSDQLLVYFLQPVISNRRVDTEARTRYVTMVRQLGGTMIGSVAPQFNYTDRNGSESTFGPDSCEVTMIMIADEETLRDPLLRIRLHANVRATQLIDEGVLRVVCITPGNATEEWNEIVANYPEKWIVGTSTEIGDLYDIRINPSFYFLDDQQKIHAKNLDLTAALQVLSGL